MDYFYNPLSFLSEKNFWIKFAKSFLSFWAINILVFISIVPLIIISYFFDVSVIAPLLIVVMPFISQFIIAFYRTRNDYVLFGKILGASIGTFLVFPLLGFSLFHFLVLRQEPLIEVPLTIVCCLILFFILPPILILIHTNLKETFKFSLMFLGWLMLGIIILSLFTLLILFFHLLFGGFRYKLMIIPYLILLSTFWAFPLAFSDALLDLRDKK